MTSSQQTLCTYDGELIPGIFEPAETAGVNPASDDCAVKKFKMLCLALGAEAANP